MKKTNIIYLTTRCNLGCEYCYESRKNQIQSDVTKDQIDEFISEIEVRESEYNQHTVVIMGGEPTIVPDMVEYIAEKMISSKKTFNVHMNTNGILLDNDDYRNKFYDLIERSSDNGVSWLVLVSYDWKNNNKRKFKSGETSTHIVESTLRKLSNEDRQFGISCTVSYDNCEELMDYSINILERYKIVRLVFSWNYQNISNHIGPGYIKQLQEYYDPYMAELQRMYDVNICGFNGKTCFECGNCAGIDYDGNLYLSPTKGILIEPSTTFKEFDRF